MTPAATRAVATQHHGTGSGPGAGAPPGRARATTGLAVVLIAAAALGRLLDAGQLSTLMFWLFVLPTSAAQASSAVLLAQRRPSPSRRVRVAIALNVGAGIAWLVLRTVVDPTQPRGGPVAALDGRTQLLSALALAATALVLPQAQWRVPTTRRARQRLVAALGGTWVLALAIGASLFAVYVPNITMTGQSPVLAVRLTPEAWPGGPRLDALVGGHLLVVLNASTAAFVVLSTGLLALLIHSRLEAATLRVTCGSATPSRGALAAGLLTAPGCCAVPLTALLGPAALTVVAATTPYLMLVVVLVLAGDLLRTRRLVSRYAGRPADSAA